MAAEEKKEEELLSALNSHIFKLSLTIRTRCIETKYFVTLSLSSAGSAFASRTGPRWIRRLLINQLYITVQTSDRGQFIADKIDFGNSVSQALKKYASQRRPPAVEEEEEEVRKKN